MQRIICALSFLVFIWAVDAAAASAESDFASTAININSSGELAAYANLSSLMGAVAFIQDDNICEDQELQRTGGVERYTCCDFEERYKATCKAVFQGLERAFALCDEKGCDQIAIAGIAVKYAKIDDETCVAKAVVYFYCCCSCPREVTVPDIDYNDEPCDEFEVQKVTERVEFKCKDRDAALDAIKKIIESLAEQQKAACEEAGCDAADYRGLFIRLKCEDGEVCSYSGVLYFVCCCCEC